MTDQVWSLSENGITLSTGVIRGTKRQREKATDDVREMVRELIEDSIIGALSDARPHVLTLSVERWPS